MDEMGIRDVKTGHMMVVEDFISQVGDLTRRNSNRLQVHD